MQLHAIDWGIVILSLLICFVPALFFGKRAGKGTAEYFASRRSVPWRLAGLSMVATTFSSDARQSGRRCSPSATTYTWERDHEYDLARARVNGDRTQGAGPRAV
jgi:hypothetical protein